MAFDRNGFIKAAKEAGYDEDIINQALIDNGVKPVGAVDKVVDALPAIGGALGYASSYALPRLPGSRGALAGAGVSSGQRAQQLIRGQAPQEAYQFSPKGRLPSGKEMGQIGTGAGIDLSLSTLKALLNPMKTVGKIRELSIGSKAVPGEELARNTWENLSQRGGLRPAVEQQVARDRATQLLQKLSPTNLTETGLQQPSTVKINDIYKALSQFEGGAYEKGSSLAEGTKLASGAVRDYLTSQIPKGAQLANQLYGTLAKASPYATYAKRGAAGLTGASLAAYLLKDKLLSLFGGGGE